MTLFHISQSKVRQWRDCKQKFWYKHVKKLQRRKRPRPLAFGTIVHKMHEAHAKSQNPFKVLNELPREELELFDSERETYGNMIEDIRYIFRGYLDYWKDQPLVYLKHDGHLAEHSFEFELPKEDILLKGKIDAVTRHRKINWLTEHKNHRTLPDDDDRWRSVQSVVYVKIVQMLGWWDLDGTCWDYIRSKAPTRPQLLKSGGMSERSIDTLPQVVVDTLKAHKKNPANYRTLIDVARSNMPTYFQRIYTPLKTKVLANVWKDFVVTAREIRDSNLDKQQVRTIGRHCSWCEFEPICRAELQGLDSDFVIEHEYERSTYGEETIHEETT